MYTLEGIPLIHEYTVLYLTVAGDYILNQGFEKDQTVTQFHVIIM